MRSTCRILAVAAVAALALPQSALAGDIEEQMLLMNERMSQMEGQLQATQDELDASKDEVQRQQELIEKAGIEREAQSGLSKFLSETQFSGNVAVSWGYNFRNPNDQSQTYSNDSEKTPSAFPAQGNPRGTELPDVSSVAPTIGGINGGALGLTAPYHSNHNSFQVDQFLFSMVNPATAESRGGFAVELAWGASADGLGLPGSIGFSDDEKSFTGASGDLPHLYQAYVNYLAPIGPGLEVGMGRFGTFVGAESFRADENWTITRGLVWAIQPVNHTGIWTGMEWENGLFFKLAAVNGYSNTMKDFDNDKGFLGSVGWNGEMFGVTLSGFYGGDVTQHPIFGGGFVGGIDAAEFISSSGTQRDSISLVDTVISFTPSDRFQAWINFDWYRSDGSDQAQVNQMDIYALSLAGRFGITERLGLALRYEMLYVEDHPAIFLPQGPVFAPGPVGQGRDGTLMSFTTAFDYALTDNLTVRAEGRYDWGNSAHSRDNFFTAADTAPDNDEYFTNSDQFLGIVQMLYSF
jgi:hypothetical protein